MVEPSKIIFPLQNTIPQKEDRILLYFGYHSIPPKNTTHLSLGFSGSGLGGSGLKLETSTRKPLRAWSRPLHNHKIVLGNKIPWFSGLQASGGPDTHNP